MKKQRTLSKRQQQRGMEYHLYLKEKLKGWDGCALLGFYIESKEGNNLNIEKIPHWILDEFDKLPKELLLHIRDTMEVNYSRWMS